MGLKKVSEDDRCIGCPMCRLFPNNTLVEPQIGPADILLVGEAPGEQEALVGKPFSGGAGRWLDSALRNARMNREDLNVINVIQCRPPENIFPDAPEARSYISREDAEAAIAHCLDKHTRKFIADHQWDKIVLLGDKALRYIAGFVGGIFKWRGSPIVVEVEGKRFPAIATLHPAFIARDQNMFPVLVNDLRKSLTPPPEHYNTHPMLETVRELDVSKLLVFDIETKGWSKQISMVGMSTRLFHAVVPPFEGSYIDAIRVLFNFAGDVVGHNCIQFDLPILSANGVAPRPESEIWDTMLMHHLLFPQFSGEQQNAKEDLTRKTSGGHGLEFLNSQFTSKPAWKHGKGEDEELYCARDVDVTNQCYQILRPMLKKEGLENLYRYVQVPLAKICHLMHERGFKIDPTRLVEIREKYLTEMSVLERQLPQSLRTQTIIVHKRAPAPEGSKTAAGKTRKFILVDAEEELVPWRSNEILMQYFYKDQGLPVQLHVKTDKPTIDKGAVQKLLNRLRNGTIKNPRTPELIAELQAYQKLKKLATLVSGFVQDKLLTVGRQHSHFNVHGTASGRLSSSDPNLQNQPEASRFIYVPSYKDWCLIDCDYSSIENKLTAYFANDIERLARFQDPGFNEHKWTASLFFNLPIEEIEKDNDKDAPYGKAKRINHGSNYGMGPKKISNMYDMPFPETKELTNRWKEINSKTVAWQTATGEKAKREGVLTTPFGRKRWFYTQSYFTEALSFLPQSTAADVIFRAMIGLMYERIGWPLEKVLEVVPRPIPLPRPAELLVQVHDSLVFECPGEMVDETVFAIRSVMEQGWPELGGFNFTTGIKVGNPGESWGELHSYN